MVTHHTRDKDHSSPAAADGHHAAQIRHPLDPLDAGEIRQAVEILRRERPVSPDARFVSVSLNEPPKDQVAFATPDRPAPGQAADPGPGAAVPREAFVVLLEPRQHATYEADGVAHDRIPAVLAARTRCARAVDGGRIRRVPGRNPGRRADHRRARASRHHRSRQGARRAVEHRHVRGPRGGGPPAGVDSAVLSRTAGRQPLRQAHPWPSRRRRLRRHDGGAGGGPGRGTGAAWVRAPTRPTASGRCATT